MDRFNQTFRNLKEQKKLAFMPFVVAGFPNYQISLKAALHLAETSDLLEIGFPYSDPLADGPTIQAADAISLKNGMTTRRAFKFITEIRKQSKIPITILVYANVVYQQGIDTFYVQAKKAGIDGVLVPDVPVEEVTPFATASKNAGIIPIFLVAQTTNNRRLKKILKFAEGYLYVVSVLGVTGARKKFDSSTVKMIKRLKSQTKLPLAVGFGISGKQQVASLRNAGADGIIVGSAIVKIIETRSREKKNLVKKLNKFQKKLFKV